MNYIRHFQLVDDVSAHCDASVNSANAFLQSRYVGFYAVSSAAVLELALKELVIGFARHHHALFGTYVASRYEKINGRISFDDIIKEHLKPFGTEYRHRFKKLVGRVDQLCVTRQKYSFRTTYENLLTCRHQFAHEGSIPENVTYTEIKRGFESGKIMMACLAKTLEAL